MLEKGRRSSPEDFPKTNWDLKRWLWLPEARLARPVPDDVLSATSPCSPGVGVGGGSLVYANTLPIPKRRLLRSPPLGAPRRLEDELAPHYATARRMLGAAREPDARRRPTGAAGDRATDAGRDTASSTTDVGGVLRRARQDRARPVLRRRGPRAHRLHPLRRLHARLPLRRQEHARQELPLPRASKRGPAMSSPTPRSTAVRPLPGGGYARRGAGAALGLLGRRRASSRAAQVIFAGGVLGTVDAAPAHEGRPRRPAALSDRVGDVVRTNSESLIGVITRRRDVDLSQGIAIGSISPHRRALAPRAGALPRRLGLLPRCWRCPTSPARQLRARLAARCVGDLLPPPAQDLRARHRPRLGAQHVDPAVHAHARGHAARSRAAWLAAASPPTPRARSRRPRRRIPEATELAERVAREARRHAVSARSPRRCSASRPPRTSSAARAWATRRRPASSTPPPRVRLRGPLRDRRLRGLRQPGRQPVAHHHRAGRARDVVHPGAADGAPHAPRLTRGRRAVAERPPAR